MGMHMTSAFSCRLLRSSLAAFLGLAGSGGPVLAQTPASGVEGRWVEAAQSAEKTGIERIGTLDIVPCGDAACGILVTASGACGPVIARFGALHPQRNQVPGSFNPAYRGTLQWRGITSFAAIWQTGARLHLSASPRSFEALLSRSVMPSYNSTFARAGGASCITPVS
jgi:hypothetical protein